MVGSDVSFPFKVVPFFGDLKKTDRSFDLGGFDQAKFARHVTPEGEVKGLHADGSKIRDRIQAPFCWDV